ncbi:hypothetical protein K466DRAFT_619907, partial [Polyporus arcularius HHB13444]
RVDTATRLLQVTDSQTTLDALTKWRQRHEDEGYIFQKNARLTQVLIARLRMRKAHTLFHWVKGHDGHPGNEAADMLAAAGAEKPQDDDLSLDIPEVFKLSGAKLLALTQKLAYKAIRMRKDAKTLPRARTEANLNRISCGALDAFGVQLREESIWCSIRSKHISRAASQFFWMAIHDGYMLGTHWLRPSMSAELQNRAYCSRCGECDTMSHIIFDCQAVGQEVIWTLFKNLWVSTGEEWKEPTWGSIIGAACAVFKSANGSRKPATEARWTILSSETVHLIWKLRCERVIQNENAEFSKAEISNRFFAAINSRLTLDRRTAAMAKGKKSLKPRDVESIWLPVIDKSENLPRWWVVDCGVLVGIKRGR